MSRCLNTHPLHSAYSATPAQARPMVYVICGWQGCPKRRLVATSEWALELHRRARSGPQPPLPLLAPVVLD
jgi:hypothetical protein